MLGRGHYEQIGAKRRHQIELALGAGAQRLGQALEIAKRLEQEDSQPVVALYRPDLARTGIAGGEILLAKLSQAR
ncbi:MAG: hypothetical protein Q8Q26_15015 [Pseudorhodobacter sp.]|nr:hypothetical protein [Pseudorhodobacter sp.]